MEAAYSRFGHGEPAQEVNMASKVTRINRVNRAKPLASSKTPHTVVGAVFFSFGLTLLTANLDAIAGQVSTWLSATPGSLGSAIEIGLAGLRAVQAYFFDQSAFQAGFLSVLVSLWPLILVIIGAVLLHDALGARFASAKMARTFPSGDYESES